ncbi:MAG: hypothetical protein M3R59_02750 [Verrucomicrobiota bacterium]|nr:hypothetical protein [Verrucomicrobiota bacterium]
MASISDINPILASAISSGLALSFAWGLDVCARKKELRLDEAVQARPPVAQYAATAPSTNKVVSAP